MKKDIVAITASTITSRGVANVVRASADAAMAYLK
ncbi:MAG: hypothetical protein LBL06_05135 [Treponema sp.]|nr:hypothetical protein [Treponema sp.]